MCHAHFLRIIAHNTKRFRNLCHRDLWIWIGRQYIHVFLRTPEENNLTCRSRKYSHFRGSSTATTSSHPPRISVFLITWASAPIVLWQRAFAVTVILKGGSPRVFYRTINHFRKKKQNKNKQTNQNPNVQDHCIMKVFYYTFSLRYEMDQRSQVF